MGDRSPGDRTLSERGGVPTPSHLEIARSGPVDLRKAYLPTDPTPYPTLTFYTHLSGSQHLFPPITTPHLFPLRPPRLRHTSRPVPSCAQWAAHSSRSLSKLLRTCRRSTSILFSVTTGVPRARLGPRSRSPRPLRVGPPRVHPYLTDPPWTRSVPSSFCSPTW